MFRRGAVAVLLFASMFALVPAASGDEAEDVTMLNTDREPGGAPNGYVGTGLKGAFRFFERDFPNTVARVAVRVSSDSDPVGILVWAERAAFNDAYYSGEFSFSTSASNPVTSTIKVADGDDVTMAYLDAEGDEGTPVLLTASAPWHAGSAQPDSREISLADTADAAPIVRGARQSVAPHATVRVYANETGGSPIGTGQADAHGAFAVSTQSFVIRPSGVWVAAVEPGQPESTRVFAHMAAVTGRVVRPEDNGGIVSSFVYFLPPGCEEPAMCFGGGGFTDYDGRFDGVPAMSSLQPTPGDYSLRVRMQGPDNPRNPGPWRSTAYADPPDKPFSYSGPATLDLGDQPVLGPNFTGRVRAGLLGVEGAHIWPWMADGGIALNVGGYTRHDGRFALHLKDGVYDITMQTPPGCGGLASPTFRVSVADGVATPPEVDLDVALYGSNSPTASVPVAGDGGDLPVGVDVNSPAGPVSVSLIGADGDGALQIGCAGSPPPSVKPVARPVALSVPGLTFSSAQVCLGYDPDSLAAQGVSPSSVELYHVLPSGSAEIVTDSRDLVNRRICGDTTSFSPFVLGVPAPTAPPPELPRTDGPGPGYWMLEEGGEVHGFGSAVDYGGTTEEVVDIEPSPVGNGYWILTATGSVRPRGSAKWRGNTGPLLPGERATSMSAVPSGEGYWVFTSRGRAIAFGTAPKLGDMSGVPLNGPVLDSIGTPSGQGYYMVGSDGGVFAFGDAKYRGSMGGRPLNAPVQSLVPDWDGSGYWLVASDGGVFSFEAPFRGSMGGVPLNGPVTGMVPFYDGYLMVGADGGIFNFSNGPFLGSLGGNPPARPVVSVAAVPS